MVTQIPTKALPFMTREEIAEQAPNVFKTAPTDRVSDKYAYLPTTQLLDDFEKLGWGVVKAAQRKPNARTLKKLEKSGGEYEWTKHQLILQHPDIRIKEKSGEVLIPQIILQNSYDGMSSFSLHIGVYRLVCTNGLVIGTHEFSKLRVRHMGYTFEELEAGVREAIDKLDGIVKIVNKMNKTLLTEEQKFSLATDSLLLRMGITPGSEKAKDVKISPSTVEEVLQPRRDADKGDDAWVVFNRIQEALIKGGYTREYIQMEDGYPKTLKTRKINKVRSFETEMKLNNKLYELFNSKLEVV